MKKQLGSGLFFIVSYLIFMVVHITSITNAADTAQNDGLPTTMIRAIKQAQLHVTDEPYEDTESSEEQGKDEYTTRTPTKHTPAVSFKLEKLPKPCTTHGAEQQAVSLSPISPSLSPISPSLSPISPPFEPSSPSRLKGSPVGWGPVAQNTGRKVCLMSRKYDPNVYSVCSSVIHNEHPKSPVPLHCSTSVIPRPSTPGHLHHRTSVIPQTLPHLSTFSSLHHKTSVSVIPHAYPSNPGPLDDVSRLTSNNMSPSNRQEPTANALRVDVFFHNTSAPICETSPPSPQSISSRATQVAPAPNAEPQWGYQRISEWFIRCCCCCKK
ncbi:MAG: hypothetical protein RLZ12_634 [Bacillota bacterium]